MSAHGKTSINSIHRFYIRCFPVSTSYMKWQILWNNHSGRFTAWKHSRGDSNWKIDRKLPYLYHSWRFLQRLCLCNPFKGSIPTAQDTSTTRKHTLKISLSNHKKAKYRVSQLWANFIYVGSKVGILLCPFLQSHLHSGKLLASKLYEYLRVFLHLSA